MGIAWIGHTLDPHFEPHAKIINEAIEFQPPIEKEEDRKNPCEIYPWFELTCKGEPICLNEHLHELSEGEGIHVLLLDDYQSDLGINITRDNVKSGKSI